jgi:hypothetical protein
MQQLAEAVPMSGNATRTLGMLLAAATMAAPAIAQTLAEDVTAAMQGQLAADVLEGCNIELIQHCADVTPG